MANSTANPDNVTVLLSHRSPYDFRQSDHPIMIQPADQSSSDQKQPFVVSADRKPMTFGSLFAGIGGIDLGFERAGLECRWQVEIDDYARKVLAKHWPKVHRHDDVRTWPNEHAEPVDIIAGGFPCQDISYAGKGAGLDGERSGLFYEVMRIVSVMGPRFVVLENVAALLTRGIDDVLGSLASLGYDAEWHCIPAAAVGAPHIRDRVFIVGYAASERQQRASLGGTNQSDACEGSRNAEPSRRSEARVPRALSDPIGERCDAWSRNVESQRHEEDGSQFDNSGEVPDANGKGLAKRQRQDPSGAWAYCRAQPARSGQWLVEPAVGRVAHGVPRRVDRLRCLGNAVVPQVAEYVARRIVESSNSVTRS